MFAPIAQRHIPLTFRVPALPCNVSKMQVGKQNEASDIKVGGETADAAPGLAEWARGGHHPSVLLARIRTAQAFSLI